MQLERTRGDTSPDKMTIQENRVEVDLTGCSLVMTLNTLRNPPDDSTQVYQITGVIDDPTTGVVQFSPTAEQADLVGFFYYDVQLIDSNGVVRTLVKDAYVYTQDITK